jgi:C-terminal processing protease CtpA/Prc
LEANVGYVDIRLFAPVPQAKDTAIQMMTFISNCDALIIDLRNNGGGDPFMVQLIESYFFDEAPKLLLTLYKRESDTYEQIRTIPHLPGKRLPDIPVYILTSSRTFSGGEDFSYTMKHHGRAVIVGENTGGGGHTVDEKVVFDDFVINVPTGYPIHPETGTNWEGTGVEPDISVPKEKALGVAHVHAVESLIERTTDEGKIRQLKFGLERVKVLYEPFEVPRETLEKYLGIYGSYFVEFKDSSLYIFDKKDERTQWKLLPLNEHLFAIEGDYYNVRFDVNESGNVTSFVFLQSGQEEGVPVKRADD